MDLGKIPPNDIEAEQAVLGSMLVDKDAVFEAMEVLKEDDFYREDHKSIYSAISTLCSRGEPIDIITVKSELELQGKLEKIGGVEYLVDLPEKVPTIANIQKYVKIVEEKSILRNLIKASNEITTMGYEQTEEVETIMEQAEKKIFDLMQKKNQKGYTLLKDVLIGTFSELEQLYNQKESITGVPTGFIDLDRITAGLHKSDLVLVAARPAMGKSAFANSIAVNAS